MTAAAAADHPHALARARRARFARSRLLALALALAVPALAVTGAASCSYHVERPRLHVTRVDWQGLDPQGVTLRATVAAYNPNDFELPMRDLRATLTIEGVSTPAQVANLEAVLPPRREIPVTVDAMIPWAALPDAARVAFTRPTIAYRLDGSITVEHYITVTTSFAHQGTVDRGELLRASVPGGLGGLLGGAADLLGQFVTIQTAPAAPATMPDGGSATVTTSANPSTATPAVNSDGGAAPARPSPRTTAPPRP